MAFQPHNSARGIVRSSPPAIFSPSHEPTTRPERAPTWALIEAESPGLCGSKCPRFAGLDGPSASPWRDACRRGQGLCCCRVVGAEFLIHKPSVARSNTRAPRFLFLVLCSFPSLVYQRPGPLRINRRNKVSAVAQLLCPMFKGPVVCVWLERTLNRKA